MNYSTPRRLAQVTIAAIVFYLFCTFFFNYKEYLQVFLRVDDMDWSQLPEVFKRTFTYNPFHWLLIDGYPEGYGFRTFYGGWLAQAVGLFFIILSMLFGVLTGYYLPAKGNSKAMPLTIMSGIIFVALFWFYQVLIMNAHGTIQLYSLSILVILVISLVLSILFSIGNYVEDDESESSETPYLGSLVGFIIAFPATLFIANVSFMPSVDSTSNGTISFTLLGNYITLDILWFSLLFGAFLVITVLSVFSKSFHINNNISRIGMGVIISIICLYLVPVLISAGLGNSIAGLEVYHSSRVAEGMIISAIIIGAVLGIVAYEPRE